MDRMRLYWYTSFLLVLIQTFVDHDVKSINFNQEIIPEENESNDWEEINKDDGQDGCE